MNAISAIAYRVVQEVKSQFYCFFNIITYAVHRLAQILHSFRYYNRRERDQLLISDVCIVFGVLTTILS